MRAGNSSLHPGWLAGAGPRNWDLVVNYFGDDPDIYRVDDVARIDSKGPKWPPLQALVERHPEWLDRYDRVMFPDDDLEMSKSDLNRFFEVCAEHGLELAQPSLTPDSPVTHPLLIQNTACRLRFTNFVEVMAPCFSSAFLRVALPTFSATQSGWGIDWLWPRLADNKVSGIAIVDAVAMRHTRPLGGPNYDAMKAQGISPDAELDAFWKKHGITTMQVEIHRVQLRSGELRDIRGHSAFLPLLFARGYRQALFASPTRWRLLIQMARLTVRPFKARHPPAQP